MNNLTGEETTHLICVADAHINLAVSVRTPKFVKDNGDDSRASREQRWLWECWLDFWDYVSRLEGTCYGMFVGDMIELDVKRRSNALVATNKAEILRLADDTLEPAVYAIDKAIWIRGTTAHVGKSAWSEEDLATNCTITVKEHEGRASWEHFTGDIGGMKVDAQHYSAMGGLPWTQQNAGNRLAAVTEAQFAEMSRRAERYTPPPDITLAAHNHRYSDSGHNFKTQAFILPAWTLPTEYILMKGGRTELSDIGGMIYTKKDGKITPDYRKYEPQGLRRVWQLKI